MQIDIAQLAQNTTQTSMAAIAAAVTPVVMISANAILIGAVNAKHQAMADRLRALTAEWRSADTSAARRDTIRAQVQLFQVRIALVSRAHFLLYAATACFIAMVMALALAPFMPNWLAIELLSLPLLVGGVVLMFAAILIELAELRRARATIELESGEVTIGRLPTSQKPS